MITTTYEWRQGRGSSTPAEVVGKILTDIEAAAGEIRPETVVQEAKSTNSPLHRFFEWDDKKASEQHRLWQARQLISSIVIRKVGSVAPTEVRAFVNLTGDGEPRKYESISFVLTDAVKRGRLFEQAKREIVAWHKRYKDLQEFEAVFNAIEGLDD